jgi:prepilin-type N-terminal cleavage/methylation domain-containing protein
MESWMMAATRKRERGLTLVELMVVLAVIMLISAVSLPSFMRSYQTYQVTDAASRLVNVIKFTRYEAIRRNVAENYVIGQTGAPVTTTAWTDSNNNGVVDPGERQIIFSPNVTLVAVGVVPNVAGLTAAAGVGPLIPLSNTNAVVQFDVRGAVNPPPAGALVSYVSNTIAPTAGYRAVILLPSGSMQTWQGDGNGNWTFLH